VEPICYDIIESVLKDKMYSDILAQKWVDEICSRITKELVDMSKPFKYLGMMLVYIAL
jgi:dynein light chain Tctex-type 1